MKYRHLVMSQYVALMKAKIYANVQIICHLSLHVDDMLLVIALFKPVIHMVF